MERLEKLNYDGFMGAEWMSRTQIFILDRAARGGVRGMGAKMMKNDMEWEGYLQRELKRGREEG